MNDLSRITITVCGDGGCGKSSITLRLVRSQWTEEYDPTIEDSYSVTRTIDGQTHLLMLTDTAGQEEYRGLWAASNLNSDAFLLVYDITNPHSLDALDFYMEMIDMEEDTRADSNRVPPVKMMVGNKCDLQGARQITSAQGLEWARFRGCGFMETSAREMVNIEETFAQLARRVVETRRLHANGGVPALSNTALPPMNEKDVVWSPDPSAQNPGHAHAEKSPDTDGKEGFWKKLRCW